MIKFSYNWLKEYLGNLPKPEKLKEILTTHSFEITEIQKKGSDFLLVIDVLPNRTPDCQGHFGLVREIGTVLAKKIKPLETKFKEESDDADKIKIKGIKITNEKDLDFYCLRIIKGVKIVSSPVWLKKRLKLFGINSINNLVDLANLTMLELGTPVHIFDYDKIDAKEVVVRRALPNEKFISLDNKTYSLSSEELVISDEKDVLALAGIKGGKKAEIGRWTKNILIEAGSFSPYLISKTSKKLNLITDASLRFSQNPSPYLTEFAMERLCYLIQKFCAGIILKKKLCFDKRLKPQAIYLHRQKACSALGIKIKHQEIIKILNRLYCSIRIVKNLRQEQSGIYQVIPPAWRSDLRIEEDLIEEIARLIGYAKVPASHPWGELAFKPINEDLFFTEKIKDSAVLAGFQEIMLYSFIGEKEIRILNPESVHKIIGLENPFRPEFRYLRPYLLPSLLNALSESTKSNQEICFFESANIFSSAAPEFQTKNIGFAVSLLEDAKEEPFFELKARLNSIFESLGLNDAWYGDKLLFDFGLVKDLKNIFHPFRMAQIEVRQKPVGIIGELHQEIKKEWGLKGKIAMAEFSLEKFLEEVKKEKEYRPVSRYPSIIRDLSVLTPKNAKISQVLEIIEISGGELLIDTDLFDIYEAEEISEEKQSLTFRLVFQSKVKTLTDLEVNKIMDKIIKNLEENPNFEVRR